MQQVLIKKLQSFFPAYPIEKAWVFGSQDLLHKKIDLVEDGCIKKFAQQSVEQDKILIYERQD